MKVRLNKVASATRNTRLPREVTLSDHVVAEEGSVYAGLHASWVAQQGS